MFAKQIGRVIVAWVRAPHLPQKEKTMIKVLGKIPKSEFGIACSGGVDSMAVLDFLRRSNYNPHVLYFNHNTDHGDEAEKFIKEYCEDNGLSLFVGRTDQKPKSNKEKVAFRMKMSSTFSFLMFSCKESFIKLSVL